MTIFNFHTKERNKEVQINSPEHQYNYTENQQIEFEDVVYLVESITTKVVEDRVEQIITCVLNE